MDNTTRFWISGLVRQQREIADARAVFQLPLQPFPLFVVTLCSEIIKNLFCAHLNDNADIAALSII
ncbi:MAG: hypothetical protein WA220_06690 [Candidatus Nitrosopolaris sp.]